MTKADLVKQVSTAIGPGISRRDCALVVDALLNAMKLAVTSGERIEIRGFGVFDLRERKPRMARNPRTGEEIAVPARLQAIFKPSKDMRKRLEELMDRRAGSVRRPWQGS